MCFCSSICLFGCRDEEFPCLRLVVFLVHLFCRKTLLVSLDVIHFRLFFTRFPLLALEYQLDCWPFCLRRTARVSSFRQREDKKQICSCKSCVTEEMGTFPRESLATAGGFALPCAKRWIHRTRVCCSRAENTTNFYGAWLHNATGPDLYTCVLNFMCWRNNNTRLNDDSDFPWLAITLYHFSKGFDSRF